MSSLRTPIKSEENKETAPCQMKCYNGVVSVLQNEHPSPYTPSPLPAASSPASSAAQLYRAQSRPVLQFSPSAIKPELGTRIEGQRDPTDRFIGCRGREELLAKIEKLEKENQQLKRQKEATEKQSDGPRKEWCEQLMDGNLHLTEENQKLKAEIAKLNKEAIETKAYVDRIARCAEDMERELQCLKMVSNQTSEDQKKRIVKLQDELENKKTQVIIQKCFLTEQEKLVESLHDKNKKREDRIQKQNTEILDLRKEILDLQSQVGVFCNTRSRKGQSS
jgi:cell division protein FtsB